MDCGGPGSFCGAKNRPWRSVPDARWSQPCPRAIPTKPGARAHPRWRSERGQPSIYPSTIRSELRFRQRSDVRKCRHKARKVAALGLAQFIPGDLIDPTGNPETMPSGLDHVVKHGPGMDRSSPSTRLRTKRSPIGCTRCWRHWNALPKSVRPTAAGTTGRSAEALVLGCAGLAPHRARLEAELGFPGIDPTQVAGGMAMANILAGQL